MSHNTETGLKRACFSDLESGIILKRWFFDWIIWQCSNYAQKDVWHTQLHSIKFTFLSIFTPLCSVNKKDLEFCDCNYICKKSDIAVFTYHVSVSSKSVSSFFYRIFTYNEMKLNCWHVNLKVLVKNKFINLNFNRWYLQKNAIEAIIHVAKISDRGWPNIWKSNSC